MSFDFPLIITCATIISGAIWLFDKLFWQKRVAKAVQDVTVPQIELTEETYKRPLILEYARSLFPVFLIVLIIRSFLIQPFWVPTGSLEPTIEPGDFVLVNEFAYGLRLPVWHYKFLPTSSPKLGDIMVFRWPVNPKVNFIKRVVGVPGDKISYINKVLYINGKEQKQTLVGKTISNGGQMVIEKSEDLNGVKHDIYINPSRQGHNFYNLSVPQGKYFVMGDNRDNSEDSRYWGFVPDRDISGKAFIIWMSWDKRKNSVRWHRIGTSL